jgi:hypothetical protein
MGGGKAAKEGGNTAGLWVRVGGKRGIEAE